MDDDELTCICGHPLIDHAAPRLAELPHNERIYIVEVQPCESCDCDTAFLANEPIRGP